MTNTNNYDRKKCLPSIFKEKLKHIFDRLSSSEILSTCQRGLTQNQNESLNSVVWARCPKRLFRGVHRYKIAVCDAVSQFSDGVQRKYYLFKTLNLTVGDNTNEVFQGNKGMDWIRQQIKFPLNTSDDYKCYDNKGKHKKGKAYISGDFSTSVVPDNIENIRSYNEYETLEINRNHTDKKVLIFLVDNSRIPMIINQF